MKIELIVGLLLLIALGYALYTERTRRKNAELERDLAKRKEALDALNPKLEENKKSYDSALSDLANASIPSFMLDNVGKELPEPKRVAPSLIRDVRSGRLIDTTTGQPVADEDALTGIRPKHDPGSEGETGPVN